MKDKNREIVLKKLAELYSRDIIEIKKRYGKKKVKEIFGNDIIK